MATGTTNKRSRARRDLLEEYSRETVFALVVLAIVLFALSAGASETIDLPSIAFGWKLGLEIVRAGLAFGVVAVVVMVLVRGWGGMWPSKVSTSGLDYEQIARTATDLVGQLLELESIQADIRAAREARTK